MQFGTLAAKSGTTTQLSPLLRKCASLGLELPRDLERLAVQRGCGYYDLGLAEDRKVLRENSLTNTELGVALLSPHLPTNHRLIRIGAMMLSAPDVDAGKLTALARQEGCADVLRHIADAGRRFEPQNLFWRRLTDLLPDQIPDRDRLPHPTRFIEMTGITRGKTGTFTHWLRAKPLAAS